MTIRSRCRRRADRLRLWGGPAMDQREPKREKKPKPNAHARRAPGHSQNEKRALSPNTSPRRREDRPHPEGAARRQCLLSPPGRLPRRRGQTRRTRRVRVARRCAHPARARRRRRRRRRGRRPRRVGVPGVLQPRRAAFAYHEDLWKAATLRAVGGIFGSPGARGGARTRGASARCRRRRRRRCVKRGVWGRHPSAAATDRKPSSRTRSTSATGRAPPLDPSGSRSTRYRASTRARHEPRAFRARL